MKNVGNFLIFFKHDITRIPHRIWKYGLRLTASMCERGFGCLFVCMSMCACRCVHVDVYGCVFVGVSDWGMVFVCSSVFVPMLLIVWVSVCVWAFLCLCVSLWLSDLNLDWYKHHDLTVVFYDNPTNYNIWNCQCH